MGNNQAFTSFEASVIAVYDRGVLDRELLDDLASVYEGMDIDRGGMEGTLSKDGLDIDGIILKLYGIELPPKPVLPDDYLEWSEEQGQANDAWNDLQDEAISKIQEKWGWG